MKKKIISMILVLCLMSALFCALSVSAYADSEDSIAYYMVPYTIQSGDTLYSVCSAKGIDYNTKGSLICAFSAVNDVRSLYAGKVIWLPASSKGDSTDYYTVYSHSAVSGDTWYNLCLSYKTDYNSCTDKISALNGSTNLMAGAKILIPVLTSASGSALASPSAASCSGVTSVKYITEPEQAKTEEKKTEKVSDAYSYLVPVKLAAGDTVGSVCKTYGSDFNVYSSVISSINGIESFNSLPVGKELLIPTNTRPASGAYYRISEYTVASGDTLKDICAAQKLDLNSSLQMIKAINPSLTDIAMIYVGQKLLLPLGVNLPAENKSEQAASSSGSATSSASSAQSSYSSIMILSADHGEVISTVNGSHATVAAAGTKVKIEATPESGYAVSSITVTTYRSKTAVTVTDGAFVMPSEAVVISVSFVG